LNVRQSRWLEFLYEYEFDIKHIKGKENKVADALKRRVHEVHATTISMYQMDLKGIISKTPKFDLLYMELVTKLQQGEMQQKDEDFELGIDRILLYKNRVYIPNFPELRSVILKKIHIVPYAGHPGYQKIVSTFKIHYYCPSMKKEIVEYIARCMECQRVKAEHRKPTGLL
jgi:hypothetical protein